MANQHGFRLESPHFCNVCGTILPLPSTSKFVKCGRCGNAIDIIAFNNYETHRIIHFNKVDTTQGDTIGKDASSGPTVDRVCSNCGHPEMSYKTQQTRSADEGQTVFFNCLNCGNQEIEYS